MRHAALLWAAALIAAAGCGGAASPSMTELRARASRICSAANVRSYRIATPTWEEGAGTFLKGGINILSPELKRLRGLSAPGGDADVYAAALSAVSAEVDALRAAEHAISRNEDPVIAYKSLQHHLTPLEAQANDAWGALQIPACAG